MQSTHTILHTAILQTFELVYSFQTLSSILHATPRRVYNYNDYVLQIRSRLQPTQWTAKQRLISAQEKGTNIRIRIQKYSSQMLGMERYKSDRQLKRTNK